MEACGFDTSRKSGYAPARKFSRCLPAPPWPGINPPPFGTAWQARLERRHRRHAVNAENGAHSDHCAGRRIDTR